MRQAKIFLGEQEFECEVEVCGVVGTYCGTLSSSIENKRSLNFWQAYEEAVIGMTLREVEALEQRMPEESCRVVIGDKEYHGANVDLQVPNSGPARFIADSAGNVIDRASVRSTISSQKQGRHIRGSGNYNGGGYFGSAGDAQKILDSFHDGSAQVLGATKNGHIVIRSKAEQLATTTILAQDMLIKLPMCL